MPPSGSARKVASGCRRAKPAGEDKSGEKERWAEISRRPAGMWDMPRNAPNCADQAMPLTEDCRITPLPPEVVVRLEKKWRKEERPLTGAPLLKGAPPGVVSPSELQEHGGQSQSHSCGGSFSSGVMEMALAGPTVQLRKDTFPLGG